MLKARALVILIPPRDHGSRKVEMQVSNVMYRWLETARRWLYVPTR